MGMDPAQAFVTEAFTLLAVAIVAIFFRTYARWSVVGWREFAIDDWGMMVACVVYALETAAAYNVGAMFRGLANNGMTDEQRRTLVVGSPEWNMRVGGSKIQLIGWSLYTLLLWLLKACMAVFYSRLTEGLRDMDTRVRIAFAAIGVTYVATILSIMLGCLPFHKNWQIYPDPGNHCQPAISHINLYVTVVLNVVTDLYLMSIPLPLLWKAAIPPRRKLLLLVMFSGGAFIIMAGILRCALIIADPINGAQQAGSWACRETFVAVIIGNIPMIYPLFARAVKIASTSVFSASNSKNASSLKRSNGTSSAAMGGHMELEDRDENGRKSKPKRRGPMSIPGLTTIGNDEEAGNFTQMGKGDSAEHIMALETNYTVDRQNKDRTQTFTSNKTGDMDNTEYYSSHPPAPPHSPLASTYPSQPARKVNSIPVGVTVETHIDISTSENNGDGNPPVSPVSIYAPGRPSVDHGTSTSGPPSRGLPSTGYGGYSAKVTSSR